MYFNIIRNENKNVYQLFIIVIILSYIRDDIYS